MVRWIDAKVRVIQHYVLYASDKFEDFLRYTTRFRPDDHASMRRAIWISIVMIPFGVLVFALGSLACIPFCLWARSQGWRFFEVHQDDEPEQSMLRKASVIDHPNWSKEGF